MDYKAVRKKYTLYTRCAGILTMLLILCVTFAVSDIPMRTGGVLVIVAGLALAIYVINKWYLTTVVKLLHVDLDLASWKQYIEENKEAKRAVLRLDAATSEVSLAYMTGDFETAIRKAKEILSRDGLQPQFRNFLQSYLIRSVVLNQPELSREELDTMIGELTITDPMLAEKTQKMSVALYDLTIARASNDYFETLSNEYKYPQLEIIYYKALNAAVKGETERATELLSQLAGEDERLYVVRMGKTLSNTLEHEELINLVFSLLEHKGQLESINNFKLKKYYKIKGKTIVHKIDIYFEFERMGNIERTVIKIIDNKNVTIEDIWSFDNVIKDLKFFPKGVLYYNKDIDERALEIAKEKNIQVRHFSLIKENADNARYIINHLLPDKTIFGDPFWTLMRIDKEKNENQGIYFVIGNVIPLFTSKKLAEKLCELQNDFAVFGISQEHLSYLIALVENNLCPFKIGIIEPKPQISEKIDYNVEMHILDCEDLKNFYVR